MIYYKTEKGKENLLKRVKKYQKTEHGKEKLKQYRESEKGKEINRKGVTKFYKTEHGKELKKEINKRYYIKQKIQKAKSKMDFQELYFLENGLLFLYRILMTRTHWNDKNSFR